MIKLHDTEEMKGPFSVFTHVHAGGQLTSTAYFASRLCWAPKILPNLLRQSVLERFPDRPSSSLGQCY